MASQETNKSSGEMKYKCNKLHKFLITLEIFYTVGCILNSIIIYKYGFYGSIFISNLFPFGGLILLSIILSVILPKYYSAGTFSDEYIKKYPDIWKLLHGPGFEGDPVKTYRFYKGYYDDGTDEKLNQIKFSVSIYEKLFLWTWFVGIIDIIINQGARP
jgi:hypothetical protein